MFTSVIAAALVLPTLFGTVPAAIAAPAPTPIERAQAWTAETLQANDVTVPANVKILYTNTANCGAESSANNEGGCTYHVGANYVVVISPELAYTAAGDHVLFHELGHTHDMTECEAEDYAHNFEDPANFLWSYPECKL